MKMKAEEVFETTSVSKQLRRYFSINPDCSLSRVELISAMGLDGRKHTFEVALWRLKRSGELLEGEHGFSFAPNREIYRGDVADRVWKFMRYKPRFTVQDIIISTGATKRYVRKLIADYLRDGHIRMVAITKSLQRVYTIVNRETKVRPCRKRENR
jgi:hypothetical protein